MSLQTSLSGRPSQEPLQPTLERQPTTPAFHPFFTLVEDTGSNEHYRPEVHYVFADDDPDHLTNLLMDALSDHNADENQLLLIDIAADGKTVQASHSLNTSWQIQDAKLAVAPSWTGSPPESAQNDLLLKIEGIRRLGDKSAERPQSQNLDVVQRLEAEIKEYAERMRQLQSILPKDKPALP